MRIAKIPAESATMNSPLPLMRLLSVALRLCQRFGNHRQPDESCTAMSLSFPEGMWYNGGMTMNVKCARSGRVAAALAVIAACAVLPYAVVAETGANVIDNGGFEKLSGGRRATCWSYGRGWRAAEGDGFKGSRALVYENSDPEFSSTPRQNVELEKGRTYSIEADILVEGTLKGPHDKGASVYAEWYDAKGKWLGGVYTDEIKTTDGKWRHVSAMSTAIKTNAVRFTVGLNVSKGCTGKVTFDNVKLARWYNPRLQGLYTSAYRDTAANGEIEFLAALDMTDGKISDYSGQFVWRGADGRIHAEAPSSMDDEFARLRMNVRDMAVGRSSVTFALLKANGEIDAHREIQFDRVREEPHRAVTVDNLRRTCVDGRPFFPVGVYGGVKNMGKLKAIGVNTLMLYGAPGRDTLECARTNGLMVIAGVNHVFAGTRLAPGSVKTEADEAGWLDSYIDKLRFHPALLAWYTLDELPLTMLPRLKGRRDLMARLDPDHPVWVCLNHPHQTRSYLPTFDIAGSDPYPVPRDPLVTAANWTRATVRGCGGRRAVWMVPQIFSWANYNRKDGRVPTRGEIRNMTWQCIVEGATGLIYFKWGDLMKNGPDTTFEGRFEDFASVTSEVAAFMPFLLSDDMPVEVQGTTAAVRARLFANGTVRRLVAVNATSEPQCAKLSAPGFEPTEVKLAPIEVSVIER